MQFGCPATERIAHTTFCCVLCALLCHKVGYEHSNKNTISLYIVFMYITDIVNMLNNLLKGYEKSITKKKNYNAAKD